MLRLAAQLTHLSFTKSISSDRHPCSCRFNDATSLVTAIDAKTPRARLNDEAMGLETVACNLYHGTLLGGRRDSQFSTPRCLHLAAAVDLIQPPTLQGWVHLLRH